jgi:hypothetical protein
MLDSPYVRRVAISLKLLAIPFEHRAVSVFRHFDAFASIIGQAGVTVAVVWKFVQSASALQGAVESSRHPAIAAHAEAAERLPEFVATSPR